MPVIKSAKKKLRKDKKRTIVNNKTRDFVENVVKKAKKSPTAKTVSEAYKTLDKAVKKHLLHKNKAARIKSALAGLLPKKAAKPAEKPPVKPATKRAKK